MPVIDVSLPLSPQTPLWPSDPPFTLEFVRSLAAGDSATNSRVCLGSHMGTHIDAPSHFIPGGATVDRIPPDALVGPCLVVDVGPVDLITADVLRRFDLAGRQRLLFRTKNSAWIASKFDPAFVAFSADAAAYLAELGPAIIGIDAPSMDPYHTPGHPAHMAILGSGTIKGGIEWLNLAAVEAGEYTLFCGPLFTAGAEAAPCRVMLMR